MAVIASALLDDFLEKVVKAIGDVSSPDPATWLAMGVGDSSTAVSSSDATLAGNAIYVTVTPTYESDYKVVFNHEFTWAEIEATLTADTIKEYTVCKSNTEYAAGDLMCRVTVNPVVLADGETYDLTFKLEAKEST